MTSTQTADDRAGVEAALTALHAVIDGVPIEGFTGRDLAEAFLEMAVYAAGRDVGRAGLARRLMDLASRLLAADPQPKAQPTQAAGEMAHAAFVLAVETLSRAGQSEASIRHCMLAYVAGWTANAEGAGGAETFYRYADAIVGKGGAACH